MPLIKICGLSTEDTLDAALDAGAEMVGLVFVQKSPRFVPVERGAALATRARGRAEIVALLVDPDETTLETVLREVRPDVLQLHGKEAPTRVAAIRGRWDIPVIKAIGVATREDLGLLDAYAGVADRILFDAKPPKDAAYPGGHGRPFDWSILADIVKPNGMMLSGGLTAENVGEAIRIVNPWAVDVSSGVESAPGVKDVTKISAFVTAARRETKP